MHPSTLRLICLACVSGFLGVPLMLVTQNSPQRHCCSGSLWGQYSLPQAWELLPDGSTRHPSRSACWSAASMCGFGCLLRAKLRLPRVLYAATEMVVGLVEDSSHASTRSSSRSMAASSISVRPEK